MLGRVKEQVQPSSLAIRYQYLSTSETEPQPIKLLFVEVEHPAKKVTRIVSRQFLPRIISQELSQRRRLVRIWSVLVDVHFYTHTVLNINEEITPRFAMQRLD